MDKFKDGEFPNHFMDMERLLKGDVHDIEKVFKTKNTIKVYLGVVPTSKGFLEQIVYPKCFQHSISTSCKGIMDALGNQYTPFKGNVAPLQEVFTLGEVYTKSVSLPSVAVSAPQDDIDDDLPF
jgi:hypothetical protein